MSPALALLAGAMFASASLSQAWPWPLDSEGWTVPPDTANNSIPVFVSSFGDDDNNGLTPGTPKLSIDRAVELMVDGRGDWLFIERGSTFNYSLTDRLPNQKWSVSGQDVDNPTVVTTYDGGHGNTRPKFLCAPPTSGPSASGISNGLWIDTLIHDVAFIGIDLESQTWQNWPNELSIGISLLSLVSTTTINRVLFEDIRVSGFALGIRLQRDNNSPFTGGPIENISMRRCMVLDSYITNPTGTTDQIPPSNGHAQGLYAQKVDGLWIEECLFDHNGWLELENPTFFAPATVFRHNVYIQGDVTGVTLLGNIVARGGAHGIMCRPGGNIRYNLMLRNPIGLIVGHNTSQNTPPTGVSATVKGNVIVDGADIQAFNGQGNLEPLPRGWGMWFMHLGSATTDIHHNICAWNWTSGDNRTSYLLDSRTQAQTPTQSGWSVGINETDFHHNISFDWRGPIQFSDNRFNNNGFFSFAFGLKLHDNDIQEPQPITVISGSAAALGFPGLDSGNNRVWSTAPMASTTWCSWPAPMSFNTGTPNWIASVGDGLHSFTTASSQTQLFGPSWPGPDTLLPVLPRPAPVVLWGNPDSIVDLLSKCRQQSKQNWNPALVATPQDPVTGPTWPQPTNLVHRYLKVFGFDATSISWP
jgi:hypothetical protein